MTLDGYKFDLRIYVVITGVKDGEVEGYLCDEGLARFCTVKYKKPVLTNFKKVHMHLTNYALNKTSDYFVNEEDVTDIMAPNKCSKRTLTALFAQMNEEDVEIIKANI